MKILSSPNYEVDETLHARLAERYSSYMPEFTEFKVGPSTVRVDKRITDLITPKRRQQAGLDLQALWINLIKIFIKLGIPVMYRNTALIVDEETETAVHLVFEDEKEGTPWAYVFVPPSQVKLPSAHFSFILLHELCHCLLYTPVPEDPAAIYDYEFFVDVLSIASLRDFISTNSKQYRDAIRTISYVAADEMREKLGRKLQREILRDPRSFLRMLLIKAGHSSHNPPDQQGRPISAGKEV